MDTRYNRWQTHTITQFSVAIALISGLSVAGIGVIVSLLQNKEFIEYGLVKCLFAGSFVLLIFAALFSCSAVVTRLLDFRLTARTARKKENKDYSRPLTIFSS